MKKIYITLFTLLVLAMPLQFASADSSDELLPFEQEKVLDCSYVHLALTGKAIAWLKNEKGFENFKEISFPAYIGYLRIIQKMGSRGEIEEISFIRKTDLPIRWVEETLEDVFQTHSVRRSDSEIIQPVYTYQDKGFSRVLLWVLRDLRVDEIKTERYLGFFTPIIFPQSVLKAEDFKYEEVCTYHPLVDPPYKCEELRQIKLSNESEVYNKIVKQRKEFNLRFGKLF